MLTGNKLHDVIAPPRGDAACLHVAEGAPHIDQLIRQTRAHHVQLSIMADTKANILITVSAIIVPLTLRYLDADNDLLKPAAVAMIGFSVLTICLAAYAVMPKGWCRRTVNPRDPRFNPLFVGDFTQLDYPAFLAEMDHILGTPSRVYEAQTREIYLMGQYLFHHKYRFLRYGYLAFISGMVTSGLLASGLALYHWASA